jgi:uncharacterized protein
MPFHPTRFLPRPLALLPLLLLAPSPFGAHAAAQAGQQAAARADAPAGAQAGPQAGARAGPVAGDPGVIVNAMLAAGTSTGIGDDRVHALSAGGATHDVAAERAPVIIERDVPARMRDGVRLYADIYRPAGDGPFPALLMRTPYDKAGETQSARLAMTEAAVRRGYVVVIQDTRGQFRSEGFYTPYHQERDDGYDTIEWVAALPYVNGRVGMFGLSYPGAVQWLAAVTAPPALVAISPSQTFAHHNHFTYQGGVFSAGFLNWMLGRQFRERRARGLPLATPQELAEARDREGRQWLAHVPLRDLPIMEHFPYWREWIDNPIESEFWFPLDIEAQHDRVTVPALNLTGWHDDSYGQPGAIRNFLGVRARGATDAARRGQRLIIGPWTHGVPSATRTTFGGVDWGPHATIDYVELQLRFFDYWLRGIDDGFSSEAPIRLFVMGDNVWRDEHEWPLARTHYTALYLRDGRLERAAAGEATTASFDYDPRGPATLPPAVAEDGDATRSTVLTYTSEPFERATEITGHIVARLHVESTAPDTDFTVRIYEVDPAGGTRRLTAAPGVLRARYRSTETPRPPAPLAAGRPTELEISLGYTSYVLPAGHRLRVHIAGSLFPNLHPNTWEPFTSWRQAQAARQTVHHGGTHASRIILPVIPR